MELKNQNSGGGVQIKAVDEKNTKNVAVQTQVSNINREFQEKSTEKLAKDSGLNYVDIAKTPLNPDFLKIVDIAVAKNARVIPYYRQGKVLYLAVEDVKNANTIALLEDLKSKGYENIISLASKSGMDEAFEIYDQSQKYKKIEVVENVEKSSIGTYEKEIANMTDLAKKIETVTAQEALNMLDVGAMKTSASDVHYEPGEHSVVVRFRIDGVLHKVFALSHDVFHRIGEQLKYASKMRLNVVTIPQDGRYTFNFNEVKIAVRVSSIPTPFGESFVCRYLSSDNKTLGLEELGFQDEALAKLKRATQISQGMILITGPTGSGKSTTLYSVLQIMKSEENKVITLEDPVEYQMEGVVQSQIDEVKGYTFANGLRSILRQDPDIVMLGEIRDLKTAETAAQASLTGHVLLSTLHTNDAVETIPRLVNMGLKPFMVAPSLDTIVAQRLVRKVCEACATKKVTDEATLQEFKDHGVNGPAEIMEAHGCEKCSNTGYGGRLVVAEVLEVTKDIKEMILRGASSGEIFDAARKAGMKTMKEDAYTKVSQGLTTIEELHRVIGV
ncbi:type II secretion system protein GspE [Candidatus Peregrinibacteria bacterium CG10_big_fil_rev_8_21_14_0_10_36_19]|nr:MAG: type II secretion system protein GspE [Candidatus Peregrinibacteria bacterium CG10_big_fil_rev_8_21_14_0_10_36_19]